MLLRSQRTSANIIGAIIGLAAIAALLVTNAPSSAGPTLGAEVEMATWIGGQTKPHPLQPKTFIDVKNLKPGAPPAQGSFSLTSENTKPVNVSIGLDTLTVNEIPNVPFAPFLEMTFGENGELGTTTLATMADTPLAPFRINPGQTIRIPVSVSLPISATSAAGGQKAKISLVPEYAP